MEEIFIDFPKENTIVYKIGIFYNDLFHVFYVGSSKKGVGRFGDYISCQFSASTDFKVGPVIKKLQELGADVKVKYFFDSDFAEKEKALINQFKEKKGQLLNFEKNYNYKKEEGNKLDIKKRYEDYAEKLYHQITTG